MSERDKRLFVYDVTNPEAPKRLMVTSINALTPRLAAEEAHGGHLVPDKPNHEDDYELACYFVCRDTGARYEVFIGTPDPPARAALAGEEEGR